MNQCVVSQSSFYDDLSHQRQDIRLLNVLPDLNQGRIECRLSTCPLSSADYVVLSYRWGTAVASQEILLNGHSFLVRQNLWDFLNIIRRQSTLSLWIDAICINQNDLNERSQQVSMMGQIFQSATMVLSWLGAANPSVEQAFELMSTVYSLSDHEDEPGRLPALNTILSEDQLWQCVAELCSIPYWGRVWVVQEILLSSNNYLLCGQSTLPWQAFANFISLIDVRFVCPPQYAQTIHGSFARSYALSKPYAMIPSSFSLQWSVGRIFKLDFGKPWNVDEHNLFRILTMFGNRDCSDPLDHVYALLSLTTEGTAFPVQYNISQTQLFLSLIHFCGQSTAQSWQDKMAPLLLEKTSQRAFVRNARHVAEALELVTSSQRTHPYYYGYGSDVRLPPARPNPCFPYKGQILGLHCTPIVPGNEPPILRSNTVKRNLSAVQFDQLLHIDESSSWLLCQQRAETANGLSVTAVITIKESSQRMGFRIVECNRSMLGNLEAVHDGDTDGKWILSVPPHAHLTLLEIIILGRNPKS